MEVFIASFVIFAIAILGLSVGVIFGDKQIRGHCGESAEVESCVRDQNGNKITSCSTCSCEDDFV